MTNVSQPKKKNLGLLGGLAGLALLTTFFSSKFTETISFTVSSGETIKKQPAVICYFKHRDDIGEKIVTLLPPLDIIKVPDGDTYMYEALSKEGNLIVKPKMWYYKHQIFPLLKSRKYPLSENWAYVVPVGSPNRHVCDFRKFYARQTLFAYWIWENDKPTLNSERNEFKIWYIFEH